MRYLSSLGGGTGSLIYPITVYNATSLADGALTMLGTTPGTDGKSAIVAASAVADAIGALQLAVTSFGAISTGAMFNDTNQKAICIDPNAIYEVEYDQTDTMAVASSSGTNVVVTSLEDDIDGASLFDTVAYLFASVVASTSGSCTTVSTTSWTSSATLIKILPRNHLLAKLSSDGTKIGTDAAAGSADIWVLDSWVMSNSIPKEKIQPRLHNNVNLGSTARFFSRIVPRDHISKPAN